MRERRAGLYSVSPYIVAKYIIELPLSLFFPFLSVCITYWMLGFQVSRPS